MSVGKGRTGLLLSLTTVNVCLQLASAYLLKTAPAPDRANIVLFGAIMGVVLALNAARFITWNAIHRRFPVSIAYPLSALFFPAVAALAWLLDERVGWAQWLGVALIVAGVVRILAAPQEPGHDVSTV